MRYKCPQCKGSGHGPRIEQIDDHMFSAYPCGLCNGQKYIELIPWKEAEMSEDSIEENKWVGSVEKYEGNYIAIEILNNLLYRVTAYFSNHKVAWVDDNLHDSREKGEAHAEFIINEFSMGSELNPIPIVHLDKDRCIMVERDGKWEHTDKKVGDVT